MNTHADLLTELAKYKGGEFVPRLSALPNAPKMKWCAYANDNNDRPHFTSELNDNIWVAAHDAHAHIELACIDVALAEGYVLHGKYTTHESFGFSCWDVFAIPCWFDTKADAMLAFMKALNGATP